MCHKKAELAKIDDENIDRTNLHYISVILLMYLEFRKGNSTVNLYNHAID